MGGTPHFSRRDGQQRWASSAGSLSAPWPVGVAGLLVKGDEGYGVIGHIVLGMVGALVGGFLAGLVSGGQDYTTGINLTTIAVAVVGAIIAVVAWNAIRGTTRTGRGPI